MLVNVVTSEVLDCVYSESICILSGLYTFFLFSLLHMKLSSYNFTDGFAFSQEEGGAVTQSEVIRAYNTNLPKPGGM
jgi:hypothetical protein